MDFGSVIVAILSFIGQTFDEVVWIASWFVIFGDERETRAIKSSIGVLEIQLSD
jgi:hypothetical protein